jgi:hypothetical protein
MNLIESFQKTWRDPVWSKVISVGIVALITFIYTWISSIFNNISIGQSFERVFNLKIRIVYLIAFWVLYNLTVKLIKNGNKNKYSDKKRKALQAFNRIENKDLDIIFTWKVHFDGETPFIVNLTAFCTKHDGAPIRFINEKCPIGGCKNNSEERRLDMSLVENYIESQLIDHWNRLSWRE